MLILINASTIIIVNPMSIQNLTSKGIGRDKAATML
jgi:hypothetical protein